jgi:hypothetical protein
MIRHRSDRRYLEDISLQTDGMGILNFLQVICFNVRISANIL